MYEKLKPTAKDGNSLMYEKLILNWNILFLKRIPCPLANIYWKMLF